ncbi:MAG: hypothetical protein QOF78_3605 [Phycisphaerales bacterium]|jgi:hypothetical protein|nr:hypothetical protein [Phycisphaerales bacterium]
MGRKFIPTLLAIVVTFVTPPLLRAGLIFNSGVLHASSSASGPAGSFSNAPSDVIMTTRTASHSTSVFSGIDSSANAATNVTIGPDAISINANSNFTYQTGRSSASASVSGVATFTKVDAEYMSPYASASPNRGSGNVSIQNASNVIVYSYSSSSPPTSTPIILFNPGVYTINWNWGTRPFVGTGGPTSMSFQLVHAIPEPGALLALALPPAFLIRRRARR